jgi:hypothetical protein
VLAVLRTARRGWAQGWDVSTSSPPPRREMGGRRHLEASIWPSRQFWAWASRPVRSVHRGRPRSGAGGGPVIDWPPADRISRPHQVRAARAGDLGWRVSAGGWVIAVDPAGGDTWHRCPIPIPGVRRISRHTQRVGTWTARTGGQVRRTRTRSRDHPCWRRHRVAR